MPLMDDDPSDLGPGNPFSPYLNQQHQYTTPPTPPTSPQPSHGANRAESSWERDARLLILLARPSATRDEPTDTAGHWTRLLVVQRALSWPVGFASARVPARCARTVASSFAGQGLTVRCSDPYPTAESGDLRCVVTVWDGRLRTPPATGTPGKDAA